MCGCLKRPAEGIGCPGAGVTDSPELPKVETGTRTPVFGQQQALFIAEPSLLAPFLLLTLCDVLLNCLLFEEGATNSYLSPESCEPP